MPRARTNIGSIRGDLIASIEWFRPHCVALDESKWADIETFIAVALRVMAKTNPSRIRDAAMLEEIKARMDGRGVIE